MGATLSFPCCKAGRYRKRGNLRTDLRSRRKARIRGNPENHRWQSRKVRDSSRDEDSLIGAPKERSFGATRSFTVGKAGRCRFRGNPESHRRRNWRRGFGATWRINTGRAEGHEIRGNSKIRRRRRQRSEVLERPGVPTLAQPEDAESGVTRRLIERCFWRSEDSGQPEDSPTGVLEDTRFGETRRFIAGTA